ncbi:ankyrin [Trematosphaeria pertusa]|uniref:Ankyrin n=1 Tax=Trematosphaeria pertusa TaxID=390896 RepID=A0A6A6HQL4_9PLEO|nr:ankyrin [Trematosphaeria pertusa]KAF2240406.1 ankyrin [Trematosphaeria pertusa]
MLKAIATRQLAKVQLLVDAGARIDLPAKLGIKRTPLQAAAECGAFDILHYLLQKGADPNEPPAMREGGTALQLAAAKGLMGVVALLIERGAEVNAPPGLMLGRTAFEGAAEHGRIEMLLFLAEKGVDLLADDGKQYKRALRFADENGHAAAVLVVERVYAEACQAAGAAMVLGLDDVCQL